MVSGLPERGGLIPSLAGRALAERDRWVLWLPVGLGGGVGLYFAWPSEPAWGGGVAAVALCAVGLAALRRRAAAVIVLSGLLAVAIGFSAAALRSARVAAPVVERPTGALTLDGRVVEIEALPDGAARVTFDRLALSPYDGPPPERVRLRLRRIEGAIAAGDRLRLAAMLMPPPQPAMPGAFDFARYCWFRQLGGVGVALGPPERLEEGAAASVPVAVNALRHHIAMRILAVLPGDRGAVATALIVGDQMPISAPMLAAYRDSGLAHILSISGLHITLAAGLLFVGLRFLLALCPAIALSRDIKKISAGLAIALAFGYTALAGMPVPALRAFAMTALVLVAVLLDRFALSMRTIAWAAALVLLVLPDEMVGPSFQMSFGAVVALIAAYERLSRREGTWRDRHPGLVARVALYVGGVALSTLIAGSVSAVYAAHHFNRVAVWSLAANMAAVPITGFWVMPWALALAVLMPLGLESWALVPMGWGVEAVNRIALAVAGWPAAALTLPVLPVWGMVTFTLGGLWLCLWQTRWRWWGVVPMAVGLASILTTRPPDLLVDGRGQAMAVRTAEGALLTNGRGGRIVRDTWTRRAGPPAAERWPKRSTARDGRLRCDAVGCVWRVDGRVVALVREDDDPAAACTGADLVVSAEPLRGACRGAALVVDRFDLWRRGPHALWLERGAVRVETVAAWQGDRPWSWRPHPRPRPRPVPEGEPPAADPPPAEPEE